MRRLARVLIVAAVATSTLFAGAASASALTGTYGTDLQDPMFAVHTGPSDPPGCDKLGVSTPSFNGVVGISAGPYSGRYLHLHGHVTLGPQVHSVDPARDPIYGFSAEYGPATGVSGTFTIADFNGTNVAVTGTIDSLASPLGSVGTNVGSCYGVGSGAYFGWSEVNSGALTAMDLNVRYTYTEGPQTRTGTALLRQRQTVGNLPGWGTQIGYTGPVVNFYSPTAPAVQDESAPQITITSPAQAGDYSVGEVVPAHYSCADDVDPAPTCQGSVPTGAAIDTSTPGQHTFTVSSTDAAGNTATKTVAYTVTEPPASPYVVTGFRAPVDPDALNVAKAGQTVPLKFHLARGGEPVLDLDAVTVKASSLACALGATPDLLEEYATGGTGLQNLGGGDYQFNWSTSKSYSGSCKTLTLTAYGAGVTAQFQFKK